MALWKPIPGETRIDDISGLKIKSIRLRSELNLFEAENVRKAIAKYLAAKPGKRQTRFDLSWALRLHKQMFGDVWKWAGEIRATDLSIGIPWHQCEISLHGLLQDLRLWESSGMDFVEQAVMLHHRAVYIHPFINGNGRWSRLLANIWLRLHDHPVTNWPEARVGTSSIVREEYLNALRHADNGDYDSLIELQRRYTQTA